MALHLGNLRSEIKNRHSAKSCFVCFVFKIERLTGDGSVFELQFFQNYFNFKNKQEEQSNEKYSSSNVSDRGTLQRQNDGNISALQKLASREENGLPPTAQGNEHLSGMCCPKAFF